MPKTTPCSQVATTPNSTRASTNETDQKKPSAMRSANSNQVEHSKTLLVLGSREHGQGRSGEEEEGGLKIVLNWINKLFKVQLHTESAWLDES